ncbi:nucleotidyltransferase family protein [Phytoactinopolyspora endophytica]|uniref:nucleotidyltransferase family protein n=1 Tax=Phytoactinopolyspora endophytica TaxID=1642495 RepID=UPI0013E9B202|nr:nucleotidyltransferase family protein [Phytoactinopolyspora endophytica]
MASSEGNSTNGRVAQSSRSGRAESAALVDVCMLKRPMLAHGTSDAHAFIEAVRRHRVAPLAHVALRSAEPEVAAALKPDRDEAMTRHLSAGIVLSALSELLDGLPWAVFKGPVLSEHAHPAPGLRSYHDVDVVVSPSQLREVASRLASAGWDVIDYTDMLTNPDPPGEMHWVSPTGILVDLHWSMINMATTRQLFSVPTDELLERRVQGSIGLSSAWMLDPVDAVVHTCLHAALTGADRMLLLLDADQLARRVTDWDDVVTRARTWNAAPALAIVLARARSLLGTPLPDDLDRELGSSAGFRLVTGTVDRLMPVSSLRRDASFPRLVARSAHPSSGRTLAAVGRRSLRGVTQRLGVTRVPSPPAHRQPADARALEKYLRAVESQAGTPA